MTDQYDGKMTVGKFRQICANAPVDAKILAYGDTYLDGTQWNPVTSCDYRPDLSEPELILRCDAGDDVMVAGNVTFDEQLANADQDAPVVGFFEKSWNVGEYKQYDEAWYEELDNVLYIRTSSDL